MGDNSHVAIGKKIPWLRRKCETVRCCDATASSFVAKIRGENFAHFQAVAVKVTEVCGISVWPARTNCF
jgi:hypothetical protein